MTEIDPTRRRRRARRRRRLSWRLLQLAAVVAVFAVGIALGEALHDDNPSPGGTRTLERSLTPLPLAPARETVTVTVTTGG